MLGLLIASAKSSYDTQSNQVQHLTADVILLDQVLAQYGRETFPIRHLMRQAIGPMVEWLCGENGLATTKDAPVAATAVAEEAFARIGVVASQTHQRACHWLEF